MLTYSDRSTFTPINTTRNGFLHFILLLTNISNNLRVVSQEFETSKDYFKLITNFYECEGLKTVDYFFNLDQSIVFSSLRFPGLLLEDS